MPYLYDTKAYGGVLCTLHSVLEHQQHQLDLPEARSWAALDQDKRYGPSGKVEWTVHHNTNLTRLHGSLSVLGHHSNLRPHCLCRYHAALSSFVVNFSWLLFVYYFRVFAKRILPLPVPCGERHAVILIFFTLYFRKFPFTLHDWAPLTNIWQPTSLTSVHQL